MCHKEEFSEIRINFYKNKETQIKHEDRTFGIAFGSRAQRFIIEIILNSDKYRRQKSTSLGPESLNQGFPSPCDNDHLASFICRARNLAIIFLRE